MCVYFSFAHQNVKKLAKSNGAIKWKFFYRGILDSNKILYSGITMVS